MFTAVNYRCDRSSIYDPAAASMAKARQSGWLGDLQACITLQISIYKIITKDSSLVCCTMCHNEAGGNN